MDSDEAYDAYKLFKYELIDLDTEIKKTIENHFKYFRCIHNLCLLNHLNSKDIFIKEILPREIIKSNSLYYYAYEEYLDRVSGHPKRHNNKIEYMNSNIHNFFRVDNVNIVNDSLIEIPNIGSIKCNTDINLVGRLLDSYVYKRNNSYYIIFLINKYADMQQKEILFNTRKIFERQYYAN